MSIRENITYNQILARVTDWIKANCANVDARYDSVLPANAKNGYNYWMVNYSWDMPYAGTTTLQCKATLVTPVTKVTSTTIDNEVTAFCTTIGLTSTARTYNVDDRNFVTFLENLTVFLATKIAFTIPVSTGTMASNAGSTTTYGNNRYVVYMSNALPTSKLIQLVSPSNSQTDYTIKMSDMVKGIDNLFATVKSQVRTVQGTYAFS